MNETLRVLVVDDEPYVRRKIRSFPLGERGFAVVGEADNGVLALEMAKRLRPHIVLADIGMPVMDGLELLRALREEKHPPEVVMLTCYEDFEKVQLALRYGASDYLTKLLFKEAELLAALERAAEKVRRLEERRTALFRERLAAAAFGDSEDAETALAELCADWPLAEACVVWLQAPAGEAATAAELAERAVGAILANVEDVRVLPAKEGRSSCKALVCFRQHEPAGAHPLDAEIRAALSEWCKTLPAATRVRVYLTDTVHDWTKSAELVRVGKRRIAAGRFMPQRQVLPLQPEGDAEGSEGRLTQESGGALTLPEGIARLLRPESVAALPPSERFPAVRRLAAALAEQRSLANVSKAEWAALCCAAGCGHDRAEPFGCPAMAEQVNALFDEEELLAWLARMEEEARSARPDASASRGDIREALAYIHAHYGEPLSLSQVARKVNLSVSWFAALFRQETGRPFTEYVQDLRMYHAKRLLRETDKKVYEVACDVGIPNAKYFSRLFCDAFGVSPAEFKRRLAGSGKCG